MNSKRTLLIPIDFSNTSKVAVRFILTNEFKKGDKIILLHSYRLIADEYENYRETPRKLKLSIESKLLTQYQQFHNELTLELYKSNIEFIMKMGFTANCIQTLLQEIPIDLIVYGLKENKGTDTLIDLMSGDCAPVLLIAENLNLDMYTPNSQVIMSPLDFWSKPLHYAKEVHNHPNTPYLVLQ